MSNLANNRRLGRGLAALLGEGDGMAPGEGGPGFVPRVIHPDGQMEEGEPGETEGMMHMADGDDGQMLLLGVDEIEENPFQPRRDFSESENQLAGGESQGARHAPAGPGAAARRALAADLG